MVESRPGTGNCVLGWLEKIFGGFTHRISGGKYHGGYEGGQYHGGYDGGQYHSGHEGGQYHGGYEENTIWDGPTTSVDALSDFDKEEIDRAIALSLAEEDQKGKKVIEDTITVPGVSPDPITKDYKRIISDTLWTSWHQLL